jgi:hypothetical protein
MDVCLKRAWNISADWEGKPPRNEGPLQKGPVKLTD